MPWSATPDIDALVVGAGYSGAIVAERLAATLGWSVTVVERRGHIAGNAYDFVDTNGVLCHRYGPHIFHTNSDKVVEYLSRFTQWRPYEHRVLAYVRGALHPIPINRDTLNGLFDAGLETAEDAEDYLAARAEPVAFLRNSEDAVVSKVGRELYELFFRGYTRKQWDHDPADLDPSVCARIPVRFDRDDRYFTDRFQSMPADGYTRMFQRILDHPGIDLHLGTEFADVENALTWGHLVYTGPIDAFYGHRFGRLPYRSLHFDLVSHPTPDGGLLQPAASINAPDAGVPWTRTTEFRWLTGQPHTSSTIAVEYPRAEGDPYYPVPRAENRALFKRYKRLAEADPHLTLVGRLANYQYLNMDQVTAQALSAFAGIAATHAPGQIAAPGRPAVPQREAADPS